MKSFWILGLMLCCPILGAGTLFIISGPSGAGKTSLVQAALTRLQKITPIERVVTYTTRSPGLGEIPGIDYYFIGEQEFKVKLEQGFFMDWSGSYGKYYGAPTQMLSDIEQGKSRILIVDYGGAQRIREKYPSAVLIWIHTKDVQTLQERLANRNRDSQEQIVKRIRLAQEAIELESGNPIFHHHLLNADFEAAVRDLVAIIMSPETQRDRLSYELE